MADSDDTTRTFADGLLRLTRDGHLATLVLDRPDKLNALTPAMIAGLEDAADEIENAHDIRAVILTASGGRAFCVGADIGAWSALEPLDMWRRWVRTGHRAFDRLARLRQPLIAVLNGHALGGGLELAATADLRIAEVGARLGLPEAGIGTVPGWSGTQRLVRRVGPQSVRRLALTGEPVDCDTALRIGLVDEVCGQGQGLARAHTIAQSIVARSPVSVALAKQLINIAEGEETASAAEAMAGALAAYTDDGREGVASFREKRKPVFQNR